MKHLSEEHLILHYYGETDASEHLAACSACQEDLRRLAQSLDAFHEYEAPERGVAYEALMWQRISPAIRTRAAKWWRRPMILAPLLSGLVVAAFFAGRLSAPRRPPNLTAGLISDAGRQRIFRAALGDHLERSQMVLMEIANAKPGDSDVEVTRERATALVRDNRLYRQTAALAGDGEFNALLDELGRVLTDIANGPSDLSATELRDIQKRIESRGLIFKIRVVGANLQREGSQQL